MVSSETGRIWIRGQKLGALVERVPPLLTRIGHTIPNAGLWCAAEQIECDADQG